MVVILGVLFAMVGALTIRYKAESRYVEGRDYEDIVVKREYKRNKERRQCTKEMKVDMNGDGKLESVCFKEVRKEGKSSITANGKFYFEDLNEDSKREFIIPIKEGEEIDYKVYGYEKGRLELLDKTEYEYEKLLEAIR